MLEIPQIHLSIERMRYEVVHAFAAHSEELKEEIDRAITAAIKDFDFMAIVKQEAEQVLREAVKRNIAQAASAILWEEPICGLIKAGAANKVKQAIEQSLADR
jgi:hypothetical protein